LTVAPALWVAWGGPGSALAGVPTTSSAGAGWIALCALPAAALSVLRARALPRGIWLAAAVAALAAAGLARAGDPFEARRALLAWTNALALAGAGASLGPRGRAVLVRGLALAAGLALCAVPIGALPFGPPAGAALGRGAWGGALGNSGHLAELALPGALAGTALVLARARAVRAFAYALALGTGLFAGLAPSLTALGAWAAASAALGVVALRRPTARALVPPAGLALALGLTAFAVRASLGAGQGAPSASAASDLGGLEVRWRIWRRAAALLADAPLFGVGPGQFEREFPPYRDPAELVASSHGRAEPTPVEVEHAHNDWLEGLLELGLAGGLPWLVLLGWALARAARALAGREPARVALGAAGLATLVASGAGSTLLASPGAPAAAWPVIGALLAGGARARKPGAARALALGALGALALQSPSAWSFARHGRALADLAAAAVQVTPELAGLDAARAEDPIARALAAAPDSVVALEKQAEWLRAAGAPPAERIAAGRRLLELRPYRLATLLNLGMELAGSGSFDEAEEVFERALRLDPTHPALLRDRLRLAAERGDGAALVERLAAARAAGALEPSWLERTVADLLLAGRPTFAQPLVWELEPQRSVTDASSSYEWAKELASAGAPRRLADAALANAHFGFAREHVAEGVPETAVRSYRQALRVARDYPDLPDGAACVRLELAAAEVLAGRPEDARATWGEVPAGAARWTHLPDWAREALAGAGWSDLRDD